MFVANIEIVNYLMAIIGCCCGFAFAAFKVCREAKAKEWQERYGNTDFENPYRRR